MNEDQGDADARRGTAVAVLLTAILLLALPLASAAQTPDSALGNAFELRFDNDTLAGTDRCYTGGLTLHWVRPPRPPGSGRLQTLLAGDDPGVRTGLQLTLAQAIYTPDNIRRSDIVPDDRPYAGVLTLGVGIPVFRQDRTDLYTLALGVVGPASGAEQSQKLVHRFIDSADPAGWHHQLRNEPVVQLRWDRRWREWAAGETGGLGIRAAPHLSLGAGSLATDAALGGTVRTGWNLSADPGWRSIRPGGARAPGGTSAPGFRVELHATLVGRAVARDILLDGNHFQDSHSVRRTPLTADLVSGVEVGIGQFSIAYDLVFWTRKFSTESRKQVYSSVAFRVN